MNQIQKNDLIVARIISSMLHPLVLPTIAITILLFMPSYITFSVPADAKKLILGIVFINTCIAPVLIIVLLKKFGFISDMKLNDRQDRYYPMIISMIFYLFTFYLFKQANLPSLISFFMMAAAITLLVGMVITYFWKISLHMMSMGGFIAFLIVTSLSVQIDLHFLVLLSILFSGMLGTSRLKLNAHNPSQVYSGFLVGVGIMMFLYWYAT